MDFFMAVSNGSSEPFFLSRFKVSLGTVTWGPTLVGTLRPWGQAELRARVMDVSDPAPDWNAFARVADVNGNYWVVSAKGERTRDPASETERWIEEGRAFAASGVSVEERGTVSGVNAGSA
jgi:hypothetical protein